LVSALNKYWRPLTVQEYLHGMDVNDVRNAVTVAQFTEGVSNWIWEEQKKDGLVWLS
jgi:hypothetical protein